MHISFSCRSISSTVVCYILQFGGLYPLNITALLGGLASHHLSLWAQHPPTEVFQVFSFGLKANDQRKHFQYTSIDQQWAGFNLILFKMPCFANSELLEVLRFVQNSKTFRYFLNRNALEQVWLVWRETVKRFRRQCVCNYLPVNWTSWSRRNFALNSYNSEQEFLNLVPALAVVMMPCDIPKSMHVKF